MDKRLCASSGLLLGSLLMGFPALAQAPPPVGGVTGTVALEGTVDSEYKAGNTIIVKTLDGVQRLFHLTDRTTVHGALAGLEKGSSVVVHYTTDGRQDTASEIDRVGDDGLRTTEGVITKIDRKAKTISIRLADGSSQTLRLSERAASDVGKDVDGGGDTSKVIVYYTDEAGQRVAHYFKRVS